VVAGMKQNNRPRVIIITGSIGTGKSTAVNVIIEMGFKVLDSDQIVHDGYKVGKMMHDEVVKYFGAEILACGGEINRKKLGEIVFSNETNLEKLNEIVHRFVVKELVSGIENSNEKVIFLDIPLLLEEKDKLKEYGLIYDEIWLVYVNSDIQKDRLRKRAISENKNPEDVLKIIDKQISIELKKTMVDEVIFNEGTIQELRKQIETLLMKYK
jgi:dephospho-CoA kinase